MKRIGTFMPLIFLSGLALLFFTPQPVDLVWIEKTDESVRGFLQAYRVEVVQELDACFIARIGRDDLSLLERNRISHSVLDRNIRRRRHFLVYSPSPFSLEILRQKGRVVVVEESTILFWVEKGDPAEAIPPEFPRKPLPERSILPYLLEPSIPGEVRRPELIPNEVIQRIVDEVSPDNLRYLVQSLQDFQTRYASTPNCEAAGEFIYRYFLSLGLDAVYQPFTFGTTHSSKNVIAEMRGRTYPEDILVICGHYDSTSKSPATLAPGADDNASGTAAVMEAARLLAGYPLDFTVRFVAFSAEEWGLFGSRAYAWEARNRNERIIGVINLDMIAYADMMPEDLEIIVNPASEWMAERTILASRTYSTLVVNKIVSSSFVYSDHASFWEKGYYALCGIEDNPIRNPYYHTVYDTVDTLNFQFYTDSAKVALATLAELAQPLKHGYPLTPSGLTGRTETYSSLFQSVKNVHLAWTHGYDAVSYNIYRTTVPRLNHQKINSMPVNSAFFIDRNIRTDTRYFYAVTAVGASGLESNFSRELEVLPDNLYQVSQARNNFFIFQMWGIR